jgi:CrcB protein
VTWVWIALGGALGSVGRYGVSLAVNERMGVGPWGTFAANITGSLLIGFLAVIFTDRVTGHDDLRRFAIVGVLGGYTTFSTLAYDTTRLLEGGEIARAALNGLGSLVAGVIAVAVGMALARAIMS